MNNTHTLQSVLETVISNAAAVENAAISHFSNDEDQTPTLWVYIWRRAEWSTPEGVVEVSEGDWDGGKVYGYQIA